MEGLTEEEVAWALGRCDEGSEIKPIEGFPGYYVSACGRVFSKARFNKLVELKGRGTRHLKVRLNGGVRKFVHRLVAEAFLPAPVDPGAYVLHWDDNPANNNVKNLRFGNQKQNHKDAIRNGRIKTGERHPNAKLTDLDVLEIYGLIRQGAGTTALAMLFDVTKPVICAIKTGKTWRHLYDAEAMEPFTRDSRCSLSEDQVIEIYRLVAAGHSDQCIERRLGVLRRHIWDIRNGRKWKHLYARRHELIYTVEASRT